MLNREKVIRGLECHVNEYNCRECPYKDAIHPGWGCHLEELIADAFALLRKQEPVKPDEMIDDFYPIGDPLRTIGWKCGQCGERIAYHDKYCPTCGKAVKWDA